MDKDYRDIGIETYGDRCELCGYSAIVEVHHTNYQEHQEMENKMRQALSIGNLDVFDRLLEDAKKQGWMVFDKKTKQLDKGKRPDLLSVLCGNCHSLIHKMDVGKKLLKAIKPRK